MESLIESTICGNGEINHRGATPTTISILGKTAKGNLEVGCQEEDMTDSKEGKDSALALRGPDYVVSAAKAVLGAAPFVGNLLGELVGVVIPNQRTDRLVKFAIELESRLVSLEDRARDQLRTNEHFSELLEEGLRQASRSLSDERREYIASIVANSLTPDAIASEESRHLLRILGELNDIEIIWLRFYVDKSMGGDAEFRDKHREILRPISRSQGQPQSEFDRAALQDSYKQHLFQLGLLEAEMTSSGSTSDRINYKLTSLGRLLLKQIGLKERRRAPVETA